MGTICLTALSLLPSAAAAQPPRARPPVEEILILRSVRLPRQAPGDFCGASGLGTAADARVGDFHARGEVGGMPLLARGQCRVTGEGVPEAGLTLYACQFDLSGLPPEYVGGRLTTNTVQGRAPVGADSDPPGYTQPSIATIRLWKKR